jgi:hypothetical protein
MLDQLINLVKENASEAIINNNDVPNENNDAVINTTANGIMDHLKGLAGGGGLESITSLLSNGASANGMEMSNMSSHVANLISSKFGIDPSKSEGIVNNLLPMVMNSLSKKTNDPEDSSFTMQGILGSLTGGEGNDLGGLLGKVSKLF